MNQETQLNLARKWRSASFEELVGQETAVRILKNSLYINQFFPVYLFAGQRGCGKTSAARIFAAAANCAHLYDFQQSPQAVKVPCHTCDSCKAMSAGKHPDFTEIDAASHTGVDNVRQLIETASYLPLLGRKKIYLIDEAHMLSRAAFNAFLKILEEPPLSVIFILATTDDQKIIDTVKSRCFQLHFRAINFEKLTQHLQAVCTAENINAQHDALVAIAEQSGGSARDALNLLEQVRFSTTEITQDAVFRVLGRLPDDQIDKLLEVTRTASTLSELRQYITSIELSAYNPETVWQRLLVRLRAQVFSEDEIVATAALRLFERAIQYDELFSATIHKNIYLPMFFVSCWSYTRTTAAPISGEPAKESVQPQAVRQPNHEPTRPIVSTHPVWQRIVEHVSRSSEPIIVSLIKQAEFRSYDEQSAVLIIALDKKLNLFSDHFEGSSSRFTQIVQELLGKDVAITVLYNESDTPSARLVAAPTTAQLSAQTREVVDRLPARNLAKQSLKIDQETMPATHALLQEFAGTVTEIIN